MNTSDAARALHRPAARSEVGAVLKALDAAGTAGRFGSPSIHSIPLWRISSVRRKSSRFPSHGRFAASIDRVIQLDHDGRDVVLLIGDKVEARRCSRRRSLPGIKPLVLKQLAARSISPWTTGINQRQALMRASRSRKLSVSPATRPFWSAGCGRRIACDWAMVNWFILLVGMDRIHQRNHPVRQIAFTESSRGRRRSE